MTAVFGELNDVVDCLEKELGMTRPCTLCWAKNMRNTKKYCLFTCLSTMFTGFMSDNNVPGAGEDGWLNQCKFCDERMSGPAFVECSGTARRRLGIVSDLERNPAENCNKTDVNWIDVDWDVLFPGMTLPAP